MGELVYIADVVLRRVSDGYLVEKDRQGVPGAVLRLEEVLPWLNDRRGQGALVVVLS